MIAVAMSGRRSSTVATLLKNKEKRSWAFHALWKDNGRCCSLDDLWDAACRHSTRHSVPVLNLEKDFENTVVRRDGFLSSRRHPAHAFSVITM